MIYSLGYQNRDSTQLTSVLSKHAIKHVLDVRLIAWSQKPLYRKERLERFLTLLGISYQSEPELGNLGRDPVETYKPTTKQTNLLADILRETRCNVAVMCYEAEHSHCHRAALLDSTHLRYKIIEPWSPPGGDWDIE